MNVRMLRDRILVSPIERIKSSVLEVISDERPNVGVIVSTGPECDAVKPGDKIRFGGQLTAATGNVQTTSGGRGNTCKIVDAVSGVWFVQNATGSTWSVN